MLRYQMAPDLLPETWTPESRVQITAPIFDLPSHTDTKTIMRGDGWEVRIPGFAALPMGSIARFTGSVERRVIGGKTSKLVMNDPTISIITYPDARQVPIVEALLIRLAQLREWGVGKLGSGWPEPMASLTAGILLGVQKELPHDFYQALAQTGTLHMVAASGYNVMLVAGLITALCVSWAGRRGGTFLSILGIWLYVGLSGGSPSVVRAGIMGSLTLSAYFWGRPTEAKYLLGITVFVWGMIQPRILGDIGFQLSVVATAGILYGVPILDRIFGYFGWGQSVLTSLTRALSPTLAATIATAPLILWYFGRLSPWSVAINLLLLPIVPWIMGLTALVLTAALLHLTPLVSLLAWLTYGPLWYFVQVVTYGARLY